MKNDQPELTESTNEVEEQLSSRRTDPELLTLQRLVRMMEDLEEPAARSRCMAYLAARYIVTP